MAQPGLRAVERLNLALFVDRQDDGVRRRVDVEPDDVAQFVDEPRVFGKLEVAHAVRLEAVGAPDSLDGTEAEPRGFRHQGAGPVGCLAGRFAKRQGDDALGRLSPERLDAPGARLVAKQTFEPFLHEALLPAPDAVLDVPVRRMIWFVPTPSAGARRR
jgi:hypothetical protein